ncbi:MAG: hypothetical protein DGJ47_001196, partial [Rickettsiaceae bacterium]
ELTKFKEFMKKVEINQDSPVKHQWLKFLLKCHEATSTPDDVAEVIKEGYEIMKMANWSPTQKALYDMRIDEEALQQSKIAETAAIAEARGRAEGEARGEARGRAEGEAKSIQKAFRYEESESEILNDHSSLNQNKLNLIKELPYPPEHNLITEILLNDFDNSSVQEKEDYDNEILGDNNLSIDSN